MVVKWTQHATNDLIAVRDYIARDSLRYAMIVTERILDRTHQLELFPDSGAIVTEYARQDVREVFVHSYRIIYQRLETEVRILTVCHGALLLPNSPPLYR